MIVFLKWGVYLTIKKAIIPAAGLGTRFLPATKAQPKEMLPIVDKPAIQYIVEEAVESGIEDIVIVTGKNKRAIEDHFDFNFELEENLKNKNKNEHLEMIRKISSMANIFYVRQKETLGLGHAIYCAKSFIGNDPFAVLLGDDIINSNPPTLKQMIDLYEQEKKVVLAVQKVENKDVDKYGIIDPIFSENKIKINDLIEKPKLGENPSNYGIIGRYILEPDVFDVINTLKPGANKEIQLTDALRILNQKKQMLAYELKEKRYDIGDKIGYIKAIIDVSLSRNDLSKEIKKYLKKWR
jgi:UTP--glucose-1-phosphate uridylyltransferase